MPQQVYGDGALGNGRDISGETLQSRNGGLKGNPYLAFIAHCPLACPRGMVAASVNCFLNSQPANITSIPVGKKATVLE